MIAKGNLHSDGARLAAYLFTADRGEKAELFETRGLEGFGANPVLAFATLQQVSDAQTRAEKPFFHCQTRLAPGETLTDAQWLELADREEKRLGFEGQPRILSFHIDDKTGDKHMHAAWFRIDLEAMQAIDPGLFKNRLLDVSRTAERDFALREIGNRRQPHDRARAADRKEVEEGYRLGTDVRAIRTAILDCFEQSDGGKAFKAALEAQGLMLANGDRRDCFVVVDPAGGQHALNKKLTGQTLAVTRERLADLDRSQLPGVTRAQEMQAERHLAQNAAQKPRLEALPELAGEGRPAPKKAPDGPQIRPLGATAGEIRLAWQLTGSGQHFAEHIADKGMKLVYVTAEQAAASQRAQQFAKAVDRQNRALREGFAVVDARGSVTRIDQRVTGYQGEEVQKKLGGIDRAGLQPVADARQELRDASRAAWKEQKRAEREKASIDAPSGKTAGDIRMAWMLSRAGDPTRSAEQLEEALLARGLMLARVSATEAYVSERRHAFAAAIGNRATAFKEGEIVAVNEFGTPYRLNARATGVLQPEIDARLAGIDRDGLLDIADATAVMREASLAAWLTEQERTRPPSVIEARITECGEQARHSGAVITCNADGERVSGADALADRLKPEDERVLTTRTIFGQEALAARLDEAGIALARVTAADIAALAALRQDESLGQLAAHSNNEARRSHRFADKIVEGDIAAVTRGGDVHWISVEKLGIDARLFAVATLPSVTDARRAFEIDSQSRAELWAGKREEVAAAAELREEWRDLRQTVREAERTVDAAFETPAAAVEKDIRRTGRAAAMAAKVFETGFNLMFGWAMAGPKLTPQQQRDEAKARTNEETLHAEAYAGIVQAKEVEHDDRMHAQKTAQQEKDLRLAATLGIPPTAEAALNRDEFERQREADRER